MSDWRAGRWDPVEWLDEVRLCPESVEQHRECGMPSCSGCPPFQSDEHVDLALDTYRECDQLVDFKLRLGCDEHVDLPAKIPGSLS